MPKTIFLGAEPTNHHHNNNNISGGNTSTLSWLITLVHKKKLTQADTNGCYNSYANEHFSLFFILGQNNLRMASNEI